ncbi:MAG: DUF2029 domain-containing protein [Leptospiraceae bacterium]|nr:DUF2029 domain-containing protein [Leptospiraceae bacterium]
MNWKRFSFLIPWINAIILLSLLIQGISKSSQISDFRDYRRAAVIMQTRADIYQYEETKNLSGKYTLDDILKNPNLFKQLEALKGNIASYIYPPTFAFLLMPLSYIEYNHASMFFIIFNFLALLGTIYLLSRMIPSENFSKILMVTLIINYRFLENHGNNNQVAFLLMFLILLAIYTKNDFLSGGLLSLAVIIKLTPLIFILYYISERRWRAMLYFTLGLGFWIFLPFVQDPDYALKNWKNWIDMVLINTMKNPAFRAWKNNQSLIATLSKYFLDGADTQNQLIFRLPIVSLTMAQIKLIFNIITGILLIPLFIKLRKGIETLPLISALFILSVLLSGISWVHTFSFFVVPVAYVYSMYLETNHAKFRTYLYVFGGIVILTSKQISGPFLEPVFMMFSILLYAGLFLYYQIFYILEGGDEEESESSSPVKT